MKTKKYSIKWIAIFLHIQLHVDLKDYFLRIES